MENTNIVERNSSVDTNKFGGAKIIGGLVVLASSFTVTMKVIAMAMVGGVAI